MVVKAGAKNATGRSALASLGARMPRRFRAGAARRRPAHRCGGCLTDGMALLYNKTLRNTLAVRWLQPAGPPADCPRVGEGIPFWSRMAGEAASFSQPDHESRFWIGWTCGGRFRRVESTQGDAGSPFLAPAAYERERGVQRRIFTRAARGIRG